MSAATGQRLDYSAEILSPELVLVDPQLATTARALLSVPETGEAGHDAGAALRRIMELSEIEPPQPRRRHRLVSVVALTAAWAAVVVFVADVQLGLWPS